MTLYARYIMFLIVLGITVACASVAGVIDQALSNLCYEIQDPADTDANSTSRIAQSSILDPWFKTVECLLETGETPPTLQETAKSEKLPSSGS